jgi:hypothetical protein
MEKMEARMMRRMVIALWACAAVGLTLPRASNAAPSEPAKPLTVAIFEFELIDTSLEGASHGPAPAETARLKLISDLLRNLLSESDRYKVLDLSPALAEIANAGFIHGCNGCDIKIARSLGAERSITGAVIKVSTLILSLNIVERDVATGRTVDLATAQIRGDTDESWSHGVRWLVRNRLLAGN